MSSKKKPQPDAPDLRISDRAARALRIVSALVETIVRNVADKVRLPQNTTFDVLISYPTSRPVSRFALAEDDDAAQKAARPYQVIHPARIAADAPATLAELARASEQTRAGFSTATKTLALVSRPALLISPEIIADPFAVAGSAARAVLDLLAPPEQRKGGGITTKTERRAKVAETLGYNAKTDSFTALVAKVIKDTTSDFLTASGGMDGWRAETDAALHLVNLTTPPAVTYVQIRCAGDEARRKAAAAAKQPKPNSHVYLSTPSGNAPLMLAKWRCPVDGCNEPLVVLPKKQRTSTKPEDIKTDIKTLSEDIKAAAEPAAAPPA